MATITYNNSNFLTFLKYLDKFKKNISRSTSLIKGIIIYFVLLYQLAKIESISAITIKELKNVLANCKDGREHCPECWEKVLEVAHKGRDNLIQLMEILPKNNILLNKARQRIEAVLIDWDDLVEDLTVCTDEEFRDLVNQLNSLI